MIKVTDIIKAVSKTIKFNEPLSNINVDEIINIDREAYHIGVVNAKQVALGDYRQEITAMIDLKYYPPETLLKDNLNIYDKLDTINNFFEHKGAKVLIIGDRFVTIDTAEQENVDNVGHYMFTVNLITEYSEVPNWELMENLYFRFKGEV